MVEPEAFDRMREKTEQFIQAIHIAVAMQLDTFMDEKGEGSICAIIHVWRDGSGLGSE